jgi:uracil-DNA glycosylase family 4
MLKDADCEHCPFAVGGRPFKPVLGEGPSNPVGVLIGDLPSRADRMAGRPFSGNTGDQLNEELRAVGLKRTQLFLIYAVACCAPPKQYKQLKQAVKCCSRVLEAQLAEFPTDTPALVMGVGAASAVMGKVPVGGIKKGRGFVRIGNHLPRKYRSHGRKLWARK